MESEELIRLCRISMCDPVRETDVEYLKDNSPLSGGTCKKFVVEFGCLDRVIKLVPGQIISEDEIIGYMNNKPVRSKIKGKITEVYPEYFVGEYIMDIESEIEKYLGALGVSEMNDVKSFINNLNISEITDEEAEMIASKSGSITGSEEDMKIMFNLS